MGRASRARRARRHLPLPVLATVPSRPSAVPTDPAWDRTHELFRLFADVAGEHAGIPVPVDGFRVQTEDRYPNRHRAETALDRREFAHVTYASDDIEVNQTHVVNQWYSPRLDANVVLYRQHGRTKVGYDPGVRAHGRRLGMWLQTLGASQGWDVAAEIRAQEKLATLVSGHAFRTYLLTGSFLETSRRSRVSYLLRRARPTVAMVPTRHGDQDCSMRILAVLCMHPLALYGGTWAGCMVPTDDVIAHLLYIRGDERGFWARANHHHPAAAEAGL